MDHAAKAPTDALADRAESAVLGALLRRNQAIDDVARLLRPEHFRKAHNAKIYAAILGLYNRGKPVDLVLLADELKRRGEIEDVRYSYLGELWETTPTGANAVHYAEMVLDRSLRIELTALGAKLAEAGTNGTPAVELSEQAEVEIFRINESLSVRDTCKIGDAVAEAWDRIDARKNSDLNGMPRGVPSGYADLDTITSGFQDGELVVVAARPSAGKTAIALNFAANAAATHPVLFFSLEQSRMELAERLLCRAAIVDSYHVRSGKLSAADCAKLVEAGDGLGRLKLSLDDNPCQTVTRISATCRREKRRNKLRLVIIDYLQLIETEGRFGNRQEAVAATSRRLKNLARELSVPVIVLAQLNRAPEERAGNRPRVSDLRESGAIEQDADVVILLHRPELHADPRDKTETESEHDWRKRVRPNELDVIVGKQRNGPVDETTLFFDPKICRMSDYAREDKAPW